MWMPAVAGITLVLSAIAVAGALLFDTVPAPSETASVRIMTYNLHSAFDTDGRMEVGAIARVMEDSGATVVGMQEVPRGRLLNATTDLVALLQQRLGFEYVAFFGTTDPAWGNAIFSRYPISEVERTYLPLVGTPMQRQINDPSVHDDDPDADLFPVHHEQLATILAEWDRRSPAVLVGDFNARPGWKQMQRVLDAGWVDSWVEAGSGPGYTADAADPTHRIDWILHTPDLRVVDVAVIESQASDHFPVIADMAAP